MVKSLMIGKSVQRRSFRLSINAMIEVEGLTKNYGDFVAVDEVSFTAQPGKIFGLLGPNGAGKSTAIGCISGLLKPTAGRIRVNGHDVVNDSVAAKQGLGVVPQELSLYEDISATENLAFWGAAYGMRGSELKSRVTEVLGYTGLLDRGEEPIKNYSGGMKRRINFGCAIMHRPKVLLLDEPTVGVDPQSRVRLFEMVKEQVEQGSAVLYTTHYMEEAELLCDELAIVDRGKLIADGSLEIEIEEIEGGVRVEVTGKTPDAILVAQNHANIISGFVKKGRAQMHATYPAVTTEETPNR